MASLPRPILKRTTSTDRAHHAVHFPPSPTLTRTFQAYSPSYYDRSPIVVARNVCALPERGCPGRTYLPESAPRKKASAGRHVHPSVYILADEEELNRTPTLPPPLISIHPPQLIPDLSSSSESDESDGFGSPIDRHVLPPTHTPQVATPKQLSFLPHSPSSPRVSVASDDKERRKRDAGLPCRKRRSELTSRMNAAAGRGPTSTSWSMSSFDLSNDDDGCLAGF